jgi:SpoVK/Ycf46/Vps4 family AAA+-type ATPase
MGETSAQLRQVFDLIAEKPAVYFFDEFDAIGGERMLDNDVGEMRRVLNSFLRFVEQDMSDSLSVAVPNSPKRLDRALYRRFDDVLYYEHPNPEDRSLLSTYHNPQEAQFASFDIASAATAQAAWMAAKIRAHYPEMWPETIRGLIVHTAEWTDEMNRQFLPETPEPTKKADYARLCALSYSRFYLRRQTGKGELSRKRTCRTGI